MDEKVRSDVNNGLDLKERMGIVGLIAGGMNSTLAKTKMAKQLVEGLRDLINQTAQGAKVNLDEKKWSKNGYKVFEANAGNLNMARLITTAVKEEKGDISAHYLVYVDTDVPFQGMGMARRLIRAYRDSLDAEGAVGLLDNIITKENDAHGVYERAGFMEHEKVIGREKMKQIVDAINAEDGRERDLEYPEGLMIYFPEKVKSLSFLDSRNFEDRLHALLAKLLRKQDVIDMQLNEIWVADRIEEFKHNLYSLLHYFDNEIANSMSTPFMQYLFSRFVTKYLAFRREVKKLVGFTGGESLVQIEIPAEVFELPLLSYAPVIDRKGVEYEGNKELWDKLPRSIRSFPARGIETLSDYYRPSLRVWAEEQKRELESCLTIGDIFSLGYDPTKLKEITIDGEPYIFERMGLRAIKNLKEKINFLDELKVKLAGQKAGEAFIRFNLPVLTIKDSGNFYLLRRKVGGVHYDEAASLLKKSNDRIFASIERMIIQTVGEARKMVAEVDKWKEDLITYFAPWNLERNEPKVVVDWAQITYLEEIWLS